MKRTIALIFLVCLGLPAAAKEKPRPKIVSIVQVHLLVTDTRKSADFYYGIWKAIAPPGLPCDWCERVASSTKGSIVLEAIQGQPPSNLLSAVAFQTTDAKGLRDSLKKNKIAVGRLTKYPAGASFSVSDPEHHKLIFVERMDDGASMMQMPGAYSSSAPKWPHIIHAGFVVKDRAAMDTFYGHILGFHVYWTGGMKDGKTDWVDMQLPDGTDWIEYMLNVDPKADRRELGVMNHIALGVPSVKVAAEELGKAHVELRVDEQPQIGRDGKWQLNLYDPDETRVELMEFTPVEKPCCSEYTGNHPKP